MLIVYLDGIQFGNHHVLAAVGVDEDGKKYVLGVRSGASENATVTTALRFYLGLLGRIQTLPDVETVSVGALGPLTPVRFSVTLTPASPGSATPSTAIAMRAGPSYFQTLALPLLRGRDFSDRAPEDRGALP